jgi:hypothetical protein
VLFRILWGFAGSTLRALFELSAGPSAGLRFAKKLLRARPPVRRTQSAGRLDGAGAAACAAVPGGTGLFANDDLLNEGRLPRW